MDNRPIAIIDSGLGGLAVARAIWRQLPQESTLYLADHAFFPYGDKTAGQISARLPQLLDWLIKRQVKVVVIACNTITMATIKTLRQRYSLPFIGTEPAIKPALAYPDAVVLSTVTTAKHLTKQPGVLIFPCPGLAEAIEVETGEKLKATIKSYLDKIPGKYSALVLGCTHYILVKAIISGLVGEKVKIIEPSAAIARQTRAVLAGKQLLNLSGKPKRSFYTTGPARRVRGIIFTRCSL
ncbi:glutamate racemase [Patescibacteria group bacterium]|nr:glutamate racemase [Patescibacteria group bacterium]